MAHEKYPEAIIACRHAITLAPQDAQAYSTRALVCRTPGETQLPHAFRALLQSVDLDPSLTDAQLKLGAIYLPAQKYDEAQDKANLVLQSDPRNIAAYTMLSGANTGRKELPRTIDALRTALSLSPLSCAGTLGRRAMALPEAACLGNHLDPIRRKQRIRCDDRQVIDLGRCNNHAVAWVGMQGRQHRRTQADIQVQYQHVEVVMDEDHRKPVRRRDW